MSFWTFLTLAAALIVVVIARNIHPEAVQSVTCVAALYCATHLIARESDD